jgi:hypothetical protein
VPRQQTLPSPEALLEEALGLAAALKDADYQSWMRATVAGVLAWIDPVKALKVARTVASRRERLADRHHMPPRGSALCSVARVLAANDPQRALNLVLSISRNDNRDLALSNLACVLAERHFTRALQAVKHIQSRERRAVALAWIAYCVRHSAARARRLRRQALGITRRIADPRDRAWALRQMIEALGRGQRRYLHMLIDQAVKAGSAVAEAGTKGLDIFDLVNTLVEHDVSAALEVARHARPDTERVDALATIAAAIAKRSPARARQIADQALRYAYQVEGASVRSSALRDVAEGLATINLRQALRLATSLRDKDHRAMALEGISDALSETDPAKALKVARGIEVPVHRGWALQWIVYQMGRRDPAAALKVAGTIRDAPSKLGHRATALRYAAEAFARTDPHKAVAIARTVRDPFDRASALVEIARVVLTTNRAAQYKTGPARQTTR